MLGCYKRERRTTVLYLGCQDMIVTFSQFCLYLTIYALPRIFFRSRWPDGVPVEVEVDIQIRDFPLLQSSACLTKQLKKPRKSTQRYKEYPAANFHKTNDCKTSSGRHCLKKAHSIRFAYRLGILIASGQSSAMFQMLFYSELSLDGDSGHTNGILPMV